MPVVTDVTTELAGVLDALVETDPTRLGDGETLVELQRQRERLDAALTRPTAAFDASGAWKHDGARSAATWLAWSTKLPMATARRRVSMGRQLRHLEVLEAAWLAGEVGEAQVGLVTRARTPATEQCLARDQELLVDHARGLGFGSFCRIMSYWVAYADPDGAEDEARAARDRRRVHLSQGFGGCWVLDGLLDPIAGSILAQELRRIEDELFDTDWAQAKQRMGEGVRPCDLARTPAQRRADALVEMARRSATAPGDGRRPEPLFTVLVGYDAFCRTCELANRSVVTRGPWWRTWTRRGWSGWSSTGPAG